MKRVRIDSRAIRRRRHGEDDLPTDPRDPDVVQATALARIRQTGSSPGKRAR